MAQEPSDFRRIAFRNSPTLQAAAKRIAQAAPVDDSLRERRTRLLRLQALIFAVGVAAFVVLRFAAGRELQIFLAFVVALTGILLVAGVVGWVLTLADRWARAHAKKRMASLHTSEGELKTALGEQSVVEDIRELTEAAKGVESIVENVNPRLEDTAVLRDRFEVLQDKTAELARSRAKVEVRIDDMSEAAREPEPELVGAR